MSKGIGRSVFFYNVTFLISKYESVKSIGIKESDQKLNVNIECQNMLEFGKL